jgi:hypothetical protein
MPHVNIADMLARTRLAVTAPDVNRAQAVSDCPLIDRIDGEAM